MLTKSRLVLRYVCVWPNRLVLTVDKHPQADLIIRIVEVLRHSLLEHAVCLVLEHTERRQVSRRPVPFIECRQVKAFVVCECLIRDDLRRKL